MNLGAIRQRVEYLGYGTDTAAQQTDMINAAYREVHSKMRWPFLEAINSDLVTVATTPNYALPVGMGNWRNLDAVRLSQPSLNCAPQLEFMPPQDLFDRQLQNAPLTGTPQYWTMYANELWFYPTPDANYSVTIYYIIEPPDLSSDSDVPLIPLAYQDCLVYGAVWGMGFRERDWIGNELMQAKYDECVQRLEDEYLVRQRQSGSYVRRSGYNDLGVRYPLSTPGF